MVRFAVLLGGLLGLVLITILMVVSTSSRLHQETVYSIAALRANLTHHGSAWAGRPVLVRGLLTGCPHAICPGREPGLPRRLVDPNETDTVDPLPLIWSSRDPMWALLRHVPWLGPLVPAPQILHWDIVATY